MNFYKGRWTPLGVVHKLETVGDQVVNPTDKITVEVVHDKDYQIFSTYHVYTRQQLIDAFARYEEEQQIRSEQEKAKRQKAIDDAKTVVLVGPGVRSLKCYGCSCIIGYDTDDIFLEHRFGLVQGITCKNCGAFIRHN